MSLAAGRSFAARSSRLSLSPWPAARSGGSTLAHRLGTTPKLVDREPDCRPIGYGAVLLEGLVGHFARRRGLLASGGLLRHQRRTGHVLQLGMTPVEIDLCRSSSAKSCVDVPGGSVSLAAGIATIFGPAADAQGTAWLLYHFVVMFEAVFILTTVDAGTRGAILSPGHPGPAGPPAVFATTSPRSVAVFFAGGCCCGAGSCTSAPSRRCGRCWGSPISCSPAPRSRSAQR